MADESQVSIANFTCSKEEVIERIAQGEYLVIAGDERVLETLPTGNWIGGTIPYFMTEDGGKVDQEILFVTQINGCDPAQAPRLTLYDTNSISRIAQEAPAQGFTVLILPANSEVHLAYAQDAPDYPNMFFSPIIGWIAGMHLNDLGSRTAKAGFGPAAGLLSENQAAAMHVPLPESQFANIKIVNLFTQGDGDSIRFSDKGFAAKTCQISGQEWNFAEYIKEHQIDTRLPLVANYSGVMVNVSIQDASADEVKLYAPVFPDVEYKFAKPVDDYVAEFNQAIQKSDDKNNAFSCNCILNFLYSELEGKKTGALTGPMTFGEVAYQLLNQTLVYLTLETQ